MKRESFDDRQGARRPPMARYVNDIRPFRYDRYVSLRMRFCRTCATCNVRNSKLSSYQLLTFELLRVVTNRRDIKDFRESFFYSVDRVSNAKTAIVTDN